MECVGGGVAGGVDCVGCGVAGGAVGRHMP